MQTNKSKNETLQIPSIEGRAAEVSIKITSLIKGYFEDFSFDEVEDTLGDLLQVYICPDPDHKRTREWVSNSAFQLRKLSILLRKLEGLDETLNSIIVDDEEGGSSC